VLGNIGGTSANPGGSVSQARPEIGGVEVRIILQDLGLAYCCCEQIENLFYAETPSPDTGQPPHCSALKVIRSTTGD
jgi:hypothetical protein